MIILFLEDDAAPETLYPSSTLYPSASLFPYSLVVLPPPPPSYRTRLPALVELVTVRDTTIGLSPTRTTSAVGVSRSTSVEVA